MRTQNLLSAYFSHSWKPDDLPLNLALWERISKHCRLLIDQPMQEMGDASPPWYISRIESLLRRSDVFIACMPARPKAPDETKSGDWKLRCSPWILFEIRLAERANLPRFILFDRNTHFRPPEQPGPHVRYVSCRMSEVLERFQQGDQERTMIDALEEWLSWLDRNLYPVRETDAFQWACLTGNGRAAANRRAKFEAAVLSAGFDSPIDLLAGPRHDSDLCQLLRSLSLLVADLSDEATLPLYYLAHSLLVPSIRLHPHGTSADDAQLPSLLRGHPAGYQHDLLPLEATAANCEQISLRAQALLRKATPISSHAAGRHELQQRGYKRHLIFISHNLKGAKRALVKEICEACQRQGIDYWEYEMRNRSGDQWRNELQDALEKMTHFIPLFSDRYEQSQVCMDELKHAFGRREQIIIRPFLLGNRPSPNPLLRDLEKSPHHERLPNDRSPAENAQAVVGAILKSIRR